LFIVLFHLKLIFIDIIFSLELLVEKRIQVFIELNEDLFEGIIENKIIINEKQVKNEIKLKTREE
jgi:hypothetical protein